MTVKKSQSEFVSEMNVKHPNLEILGTYLNNRTKIKCFCKECNNFIEPLPTNLQKGQGCKHCGVKRRINNSKTDEKSIHERIKRIHENVILTSQYKNQNSKSNFQCSKCGYEWETKIIHVLNGSGCSKCKSSNGEKEIDTFLRQKEIDFIRQARFEDCKNKRALPFDFYIPKLNICIEYDGIQHFQPIDFFGGLEAYENTKINDEIKNKYCEISGIKLIRISYKQNVNEVLRKELY